MKIILACGMQCLFLNCCRNKFLDSQGFQNAHDLNGCLHHMGIVSYSYHISLCSVNTLVIFPSSTLFQALRYSDSNCVIEMMPNDSLPHF